MKTPRIIGENNPKLGFVCEVCGNTDLVPSNIILECNYGSAYDGERITLAICGNCADRLHDKIIKNKGD